MPPAQNNANFLAAMACLTSSQSDHRGNKCILSITGGDLWITGTGLRVAGTDLRNAGTGLRVTGTGQPVVRKGWK
jgi:hypothetical protein